MYSHVFTAMGTSVTLSTPAPLPLGLADRVERVFSHLEEVFSLYRPDSEASRINSGELELLDASPLYRRGHRLAHEWLRITGGAFTPYRADRRVDLAGVVKAMAIEQAAAQLHEVPDFCLNAGGDIIARGSADGARPSEAMSGWVAGIVDPNDRTRMLSQARLTRQQPALATSGISERGEHIRRTARTGQASPRLVQVSVQACDIITADALATSILAGGIAELQRACREHRIQVLAVSSSGQLWATSAFRHKMPVGA